MKKISKKLKKKIEEAVKHMLHCHRDTLRNQGVSLRWRWKVTEGFYGEAFGILRGLEVLGYGRFESCNMDGTHHGFDQPEQNLRWWFCQIEEDVLKEEGWCGDHRCEWCLEHFGKDDKSMLDEGRLLK
jgi:hypothetical protein